MNILGINAYHGNSSAAIISDGRLVTAVEEERFNRVKYAAGFPAQAISHCLSEAGLTIQEVDHVAVPRNQWARLGTKLYYAMRMPRFAIERARALKRFSGIHEELARTCGVDPAVIRPQYHRVEHHVAHLASTFFDQAAVLSADGLGDFASTMWATGQGNHLKVHGSIAFPHSLGLYYTAISQYLGFWKFGDEYKVMGLAAYGSPGFKDEFRRIVLESANGNGIGFKLGLQYFTHHRDGPEMTWRDGSKTPVLGRLFSPYLAQRLGAARVPDQPLEQKHSDIAATLQAVLEEAYFAMLNALCRNTGQKAICLAGGVAFNCVANGGIFEHTPFTDVYVQPAAGDAGLAVGTAYYVYHQVLGQPRAFVMDHAYWGPQYTPEQIAKAVAASDAANRDCKIARLAEDELLRTTAAHIADGKVVGWFQGRQEWGPRALGNRSILVDPRRAAMKDILNARIKHREPFRPFAPSILEEATGDYFERSSPSPFMNLAYRVRADKRDVIPAPTHVDGTGRLQTVSRRTNLLYWSLIREFQRLTGVPVLLNTSFNENEPIVLKPEEAIDCFLRTKMDVLVVGNHVIQKPPQAPESRPTVR